MSAGHPQVARRSVLAPLDVESRTEAVADRLREAIFLGYLPDAEPLPAESELAAQLAVSTKTLREALSMLREEGLIDTRRGRGGGSFVQSHGGMSRKLARDRLRSLSISEIRDAADEHRAVGGMAALLAADRADDDQLVRIESRLTLLHDAPTNVARGRVDSNFHIDIAVAAQSERLTRSEAQLQRESRDLLWLLDPPEVDAVAGEHDAIFRAIERQEGDLSRALAEEHVAANYRRLLQLRLHPGKS
jgi:DNA-binding FadR family transcriptional regulator